MLTDKILLCAGTDEVIHTLLVVYMKVKNDNKYIHIHSLSIQLVNQMCMAIIDV